MTDYLIFDNIMLVVIVVVSEPGEIGKLTKQIVLPPAEQIELLLTQEINLINHYHNLQTESFTLAKKASNLSSLKLLWILS